MKNKVSVIGAGNVGASTALYIAERGLADVVLIDRPEMEGMPQGKALDMQQSAPLWHKGGKLEGASDLAAVKGSHVVVMTAGFPRKPGMSRSDLLKANADIIRPAAEAVKRHAPDAVVVVVTNPLDDGVAVLETTGPGSSAIGMAGILDSARSARSSRWSSASRAPTCRQWCSAATATRWCRRRATPRPAASR